MSMNVNTSQPSQDDQVFQIQLSFPSNDCCIFETVKTHQIIITLSIPNLVTQHGDY